MSAELIVIALMLVVVAITVMIYFMAAVGLKKLRVSTGRTRKYIAAIVAIAMIPIVYRLVVWLWICAISYYPQRKFDEILWQTTTDKRYTMSHDLIQSKILIGMSQGEVMDLLGPGHLNHRADTAILRYELGFVPGLFNIDPDILSIYFGSGKVVRVFQHQG